MKAIIFTTPTGQLAVLRLVEGARLAFGVTFKDGSVLRRAVAMPVDGFARRWPVEGAVAEWAETEDEFATRISEKDVPKDATNVQIIDAGAIPTDRTFRNAWRAAAGAITCDMPVSRDVARRMLRDERAERMKTLDGMWMRAMGRGDPVTAAAIEAKREALRNWPADPRIEASAAPDSLKDVVRTMLSEVSL
jgi:hypothetical protein